MTSLPRSGHLIPNRFARLALQSLIEVAGENGMHAVFRLAGLPGLIETLPPDDDFNEFDAADLSAVFQTLNEIYGVHGGHSLSFKAGQTTFSAGFQVYATTNQLDKIAETNGTVEEKVQQGLEGICAAANRLSNRQLDLIRGENPGEWIFGVRDCAVCMERQSAEPLCTFTEGVLDQALFQFSGGSKFVVREISCIASGAEACRYLIQIPKPENPPFTV